MNHSSISRRTLLGGVAGAAGIGLLPVFDTPAAAAPGAAPTIVPCSAWSATAPTDSISMTSGLKYLVIHHTTYPNVSDLSKAQAFERARTIQRDHIEENGWIDSGQHLTISRGGYVLEGRHRTIEGLKSGTRFPRAAHASGANEVAFGIENDGNYMTELPTRQLWGSLVTTCTHVLRTYGKTERIIVGHRDVPGNESNDCPGDRLYAKLPTLRAEVRTRLAKRPWTTVRSGDSGAAATTVQYLLRAAGHGTDTDGKFGSRTKAAVAAFQRSKDLFLVDGVVGAVTWEAGLAPTLRRGSATKDEVRALQTMLRAHGLSTAADGVFGAGTETMVRRFQKSAGLQTDGVVGLDTWSRLLKA